MKSLLIIALIPLFAFTQQTKQQTRQQSDDLYGVHKTNQPAINQQADVPFKNANTIVVSTSNSDVTNYDNFTSFLLENSYTLDAVSDKLMTIKTSPKAFKFKPNSTYRIIYNILFRNGEIIITPFWRSGMEVGFGIAKTMDVDRQMSWSKNKTNVNHVLCDETVALIAEFGNFKITYRYK